MTNASDAETPRDAHPLDVATLRVSAIRQNLGGSVLSVDGVTGHSRLRYVPGEHLKNSGGTIFGGYIAAIVDDAAGITAWFGGGQKRFATAQLTVNFLRPVLPGEEVIAENRVVAIEGRNIVVDVSIRRSSDQKLLVTGRVVQTYLKAALTEPAKRP